MSDNLTALDRSQLAKALGQNYSVIRAFEQLVSSVDGFPTTIEEANTLAGSALSIAQASVDLITIVAEAVEQMASEPVPDVQVDLDDTAPSFHLGTVSAQDADAVEISGGLIAGVAVTTSTIDSTPIGNTAPATANFTTVTASGQITSTLASGTPPFAVTSPTLVPVLYVARAQKADNSTSATTADKLNNPSTFPPAATDAASTQTLVNALRSAAIAKGL